MKLAGCSTDVGRDYYRNKIWMVYLVSSRPEIVKKQFEKKC